MAIRLLNIEPSDYSQKAREILMSIGKLEEVSVLNSDRLKEMLRGVNVLITRLEHFIGEDVMAEAANLQVIATPTTGLDHINVAAAERHGITVISLKGETEFLKNISATAELTFGLILALVRYIPFAFGNVCSGRWDRDSFRGIELKGKTLGVVGCGRLGKMVAAYGRAFGMNIIAYDPYIQIDEDWIRRVEFSECLFVSDVITIHVPLNRETQGMFSSSAFSSMKKTAYLINTSRGDIIDEDVLLHALREGGIAGAALDVMAGETASNLHRGLLDYARTYGNLIITPHIGGATDDSMWATEEFLAEKIKKFFVTGGV